MIKLAAHRLIGMLIVIFILINSIFLASDAYDEDFFCLNFRPISVVLTVNGEQVTVDVQKGMSDR